MAPFPNTTLVLNTLTGVQADPATEPHTAFVFCSQAVCLEGAGSGVREGGTEHCARNVTLL